MDIIEYTPSLQLMIVEQEIRSLLRTLCCLVDNAERELDTLLAETKSESSVVEDRSGVQYMAIYGEEKDEFVGETKEWENAGYKISQIGTHCHMCEELGNKCGMLHQMVEIKKEELKMACAELCFKCKSLEEYKVESNELKDCMLKMKKILNKHEDDKECMKVKLHVVTKELQQLKDDYKKVCALLKGVLREIEMLYGERIRWEGNDFPILLDIFRILK